MFNSSVLGVLLFLSTVGADVQEFKLPLSGSQADKLGLKSALRADLTTRNSLSPGDLFAKAHPLSCASAKWLGEQLDDNFVIVSVATRKNQAYAVLSSVKKKESGRLFFPLKIEPTNGATRESTSVREEVIELLRNSFDSIDLSRSPYLLAGKDARELVDFSRASKETSRQWEDSRVLFNSLEGDTLILREDGMVAWFRLETAEIREIGDFQDALKEYFRAVQENDVFSSWTNAR